MHPYTPSALNGANMMRSTWDAMVARNNNDIRLVIGVHSSSTTAWPTFRNTFIRRDPFGVDFGALQNCCRENRLFFSFRLRCEKRLPRN